MYKANGFWYVSTKQMGNADFVNSLPEYKRKLLRPIRWHTKTGYTVEKGKRIPYTKVFNNELLPE